MSMLVTLRWWVPSFWETFCFLIHKVLNGTIMTPINKRPDPVAMRTAEFCAASAPGANWTSPTTNTTTPRSNDPTSTCNELTWKQIKIILIILLYRLDKGCMVSFPTVLMFVNNFIEFYWYSFLLKTLNVFL